MEHTASALDASLLSDLTQAFHVINNSEGICLINNEDLQNETPGYEYLSKIPALTPELLGDQSFRDRYSVRYAYMTGAMANGIASEQMVITLGKQKLFSSFGAAGLIPSRVEAAIQEIQAALPHGPYAFNLIHSPSEEALERSGVELFLKYGIRNVEASAYMDLTPYIVWYKVAGLVMEGGRILAKNRVIAKVSRVEVAKKFMEPASAAMLRQLVAENRITAQQAEWASQFPVADDITVEADSGGHTDNRPLVSVLPAIITLRNKIATQYRYTERIHVGAAGGIGTPYASLAAFSMGASYVVTGSVNQACIESGSCDAVRKYLSMADMTDVIMAPAADMFEMGVKLQVLKRGTMFAGRAQKLYELYRAYNSVDDIPVAEREKIEKQIFRRPLNDVWADTVAFFRERDRELLSHAEADPKQKMALMFRWYLGLSSRWANAGEKGRELDYQIWCGPSMGAFNDWVRGSALEQLENRQVLRVAEEIMKGTAFLTRINMLKTLGVALPDALCHYKVS